MEYKQNCKEKIALKLEQCEREWRKINSGTEKQWKKCVHCAAR